MNDYRSYDAYCDHPRPESLNESGKVQNRLPGRMSPADYSHDDIRKGHIQSRRRQIKRGGCIAVNATATLIEKLSAVWTLLSAIEDE